MKVIFLSFLFMMVMLVLIGFVVHRVVVFTDKMPEDATLKELLMVAVSTKSVIDWILMPAYLMLIVATSLLFFGMGLAEKGTKE